MKLFIVIILATFSILSFAKEISLSFDDAPRGDTNYFTGEERTQRILSGLKSIGVDRVAFYVNTKNLHKPDRLKRIRKYKAAGHLIGNHTHSHINIRESTVEDYKKDFDKAHQILSELNLLDYYFRYPFLRRGKDLGEIKEINNYILRKGYVDAFVTVDNFDFYMDKLLQDAVADKKKINLNNLKKFYIETLMKSVNFYSKLSVNALGKEVKHVLLLHENDLAALFIEDLVQTLKKTGWKIVTPEESYSDKTTAKVPLSTTVHGQGRVVALAVDSGYEGPLNSGYEDTRVLERLFVEYKIAD